MATGASKWSSSAWSPNPVIWLSEIIKVDEELNILWAHLATAAGLDKVSVTSSLERKLSLPQACLAAYTSGEAIRFCAFIS